MGGCLALEGIGEKREVTADGCGVSWGDDVRVLRPTVALATLL